MGTSHRQAPVKNLVKRVQEGLMDLFHNPAGYEIVIGNGGSTAFWDAAAFSMVEKKAQNLVHGEFGAKFASALTNPWLEKPTVINGTPGSRLELQAEVGVDSVGDEAVVAGDLVGQPGRIDPGKAISSYRAS